VKGRVRRATAARTRRWKRRVIGALCLLVFVLFLAWLFAPNILPSLYLPRIMGGAPEEGKTRFRGEYVDVRIGDIILARIPDQGTVVYAGVRLDSVHLGRTIRCQYTLFREQDIGESPNAVPMFTEERGELASTFLWVRNAFSRDQAWSGLCLNDKSEIDLLRPGIVAHLPLGLSVQWTWPTMLRPTRHSGILYASAGSLEIGQIDPANESIIWTSLAYKKASKEEIEERIQSTRVWLHQEHFPLLLLLRILEAEIDYAYAVEPKDLTLVLDCDSQEREGVPLRVSVQASNTTVRALLDTVCRDYSLQYRIELGRIVITGATSERKDVRGAE